jgi:transposase
VKRHVLTDRHGLPLVVQTGPANENDERRLMGLLNDRPEVPTKAGRPRRVRAVLADAAYGVAWLVALVAGLGDRVLLKPRGNAGKVHGSGLGKRRYVVERTMAWLADERRLRVCYERTGASWQALHELALVAFLARRLRNVRQRTPEARNRF